MFDGVCVCVCVCVCVFFFPSGGLLPLLFLMVHISVDVFFLVFSLERFAASAFSDGAYLY